MPCRMEIRVISARELVIRRGNAGSLTNGKRKTPIRNPGGTLETPRSTNSRPSILCAIIVGKRVIYPRNVEENGGIREGEEMADMEEDRWQIWRNLWQRYKKF